MLCQLKESSPGLDLYQVGAGGAGDALQVDAMRRVAGSGMHTRVRAAVRGGGDGSEAGPTPSAVSFVTWPPSL